MRERGGAHLEKEEEARDREDDQLVRHGGEGRLLEGSRLDAVGKGLGLTFESLWRRDGSMRRLRAGVRRHRRKFMDGVRRMLGGKVHR